VEEKNFQEIRRGQERELKTKQVVSKAAEIKYEVGKTRTQTIRKTNLKNEQKDKRDFVKEFDQRLKMLTVEKDEMLAQTLVDKQGMVHKEHYRYETMKANGLMVSAQTLAPSTGDDRSARIAARLQQQQLE